jgi:hypothetical protein
MRLPGRLRLSWVSSLSFQAFFSTRNELTGSIPSELCQLKDLRRLELSVNCLEVNCSCGYACSDNADDCYYYR